MEQSGAGTPQLDACPLCRSVLPAGATAVTSCPECGADLAPYLELTGRANQYASLAREFLSQGALNEARAVIEGLVRLAELEPPVQAELAAKLALAEGRYAAAAEFAPSLPEAIGAQVRQLAQEGLTRTRTAEELYNYALTAARNGEYHAAAQRLSRAVEYAPHNPAVWQLKLKVDLKCHRLNQCYRDLAALDQLSARPPQFNGLEQLLPPVNQAGA